MNSIRTKRKKAYFLFFALLLLVCNLCNAQNFLWGKRIGSGQTDEGAVVTLDSSGSLYMTGMFKNTVDFDPGNQTYNLMSIGGYGDIFVAKYSVTGDFLWAGRMGGGSGSQFDRASDIALDYNNNVYTVGYFANTGDFDPGQGSYDLTTNGNNDIYISKLSSNGQFVWAKSIGGTGGDGAKAVATDMDGNIYVTGHFISTVDFDPGTNVNNVSSIGFNDIFILKLDSNGNFLWVKTVGGSGYEVGLDIAVDQTGNVYTTGKFLSLNVDFDPGPSTYPLSASGNSEDVFILKLSPNGDFVWAKRIGSSATDIGYSIAVNSDEYVFVTGCYTGTVDFDPGVGTSNLISLGNQDAYIVKLNVNGDFVWAKGFGGISDDNGLSIVLGSNEDIYSTGYFQNTVDFDPSIGIQNYTSAGQKDIYVNKFDSAGSLLSVKTFGGLVTESPISIALGLRDEIVVSGDFLETIDLDPTLGTASLTAIGTTNYDIFVAKYIQKGLTGIVFNDINQNCNRDAYEIGLSDRTALITPGSIVLETNEFGIWYLDSLLPGNYIIFYDSLGPWVPVCSSSMSFSVSNTDSLIAAPNFALRNIYACAQPDVSITAPFLRRCFSNQAIYVQAYNQNTATGALNAAYVDVELDSLLTPTSASLPYTNLGNNQYRFNVGNLNPGQCVNFTINTTVSCAANLQQTLCMEARLFPADSCVFDTIPTPTLPDGPGTVAPCTLPWDHSSLSVEGYCSNDTVYFIVTNNGSPVNGNMQCYAPVRVYVDGVLTYVDSVLLAGGQTITYSYPGNGQTWILQADQHPLHPGNSHPNAHVEACGNISNWTPNLVNNLPLDDADPIVDMYCGVVSGAYDPNDKTGFPTGLGTQHEILPNQQIQYLIRFQNTGTDTAFNIVVRDTLDTDLNIFSVVPGAASHNYTFRMYGPRVLEWTFTNIMLPDSNVNEATSHGFLTFRVDQQPNLQNGTTILNDADIYFDFNAPVITNETVHTINNWINAYAVGIKSKIKDQRSEIKVYPNPTNGNVSVDLSQAASKIEVSIINVLGKEVSKQQFNNTSKIDLNIEGESGVYFLKIVSGGTTENVRVVKL